MTLPEQRDDGPPRRSDLAPAAEWTGSWITAAVSAPGMHRAAFRSVLPLEELPAALDVRITADARYVFWVNGVEVGRGPVRSQPWRWAFDDYDLAPHVRVGDNELAVLVTYYGTDNSIWQRAPVSDGLGSEATLLLDAGPHWPTLSTDLHWKADIMRAWSSVPTDGILAGLPIEVLDLRLLDPEWTVSPSFRESLPEAKRAAPTHIGSRRRATPPVHPFGPLSPRHVAALTGERVDPETITVARVPGADPSHDPVADVQRVLQANPAFGEVDASPDAPGGESSLVWLIDFARVVGGFFELEVDAPEGTTVDIAYLERLAETGSSQRYAPRAGARIVTAAGRTHYSALEWNGLRFAVVLARSPGAGRVELHRVGVREHLYPLEGEASFTSSDPELERLWHAGVRTVRLNSVDAFTDCPTREQRAWVGDPAVHTEVQLVANSDWRLIRRHLELADSPRPDGLLPMAVACDLEASSGFTIPDWSLHWIHTLYLYARASRDLEFVRSRLATATRITHWFARFADSNELLSDVPEWTLGDWSSVFTDGRSSILTALWARALAEYAELAEWVGQGEDALRARHRHSRIVVAFESFWDPERSLYVDQIVGGHAGPTTSQAANAAAIVAGLVPRARQADLVARITDEDRLVTRGWNAESPQLTLEQKLADRAEGRRRIDWDVQHEIVRAEPFFSSIVHDAVAVAGRADMIPRLVKRWMRFLDEGYDTFGECWEWGTPCHGWSSTPTRDLIRHVLGASPGPLESPLSFTVSPARTDIAWITAVVPTRDGEVHLDVREGELRTRAPIPLQVRTWSGAAVELPAGTHTVRLDDHHGA